jgi:hypothetical protein
MANKDTGRKSQGSYRDSMDWDDRGRDRVRGRADEMEDASESDEFDDIEEINDEGEESEDDI